jgi:guanylate kinase
VRQRYPPPASVAVLILPPSAAELVRRLRERRTESAAEMAKRLETAIWELRQAEAFDHVVVNEDLDATVAAVDRIVAAPQATPRAAAEGERIKKLIVDLNQKIKEIS